VSFVCDLARLRQRLGIAAIVSERVEQASAERLLFVAFARFWFLSNVFDNQIQVLAQPGAVSVAIVVIDQIQADVVQTSQYIFQYRTIAIALHSLRERQSELLPSLLFAVVLPAHPHPRLANHSAMTASGLSMR
jgi:hypothetical protein